MIFSRRGGRRLRLPVPVRIWSPGRTHKLLEEPMRTWTVDGRTVTDRAGAAEHLGLSRATIDMYASPTGQRRYGFPAPLPERCDGQQVFVVASLDAFAATRRPARDPAPELDAATADELVGSSRFAQMIGVKPGTFHRYLFNSWADWLQEREGYLPRPDNWPGRAASLIDQVTGRLPQIATRWETDAGEVINEAAVAARLGAEVEAVRRYRDAVARPPGFPAPVEAEVDGQVVYRAAAVEPLVAAPARRGRPRTPALIYGGRPADRPVLNQAAIAALMDIAPAAVARYGKSGSYGFPHAVDGPPEHGPWYGLDDVIIFAGQWANEHPMWLQSTVTAWFHGERNRTGGRRAGPRPPVDDLRVVLAEADASGEQLTGAEIARRLSERSGTDVSAQVVDRLKRSLRSAPAAATSAPASDDQPA